MIFNFNFNTSFLWFAMQDIDFNPCCSQARENFLGELQQYHGRKTQSSSVYFPRHPHVTVAKCRAAVVRYWMTSPHCRHCCSRDTLTHHQASSLCLPGGFQPFLLLVLLLWLLFCGICVVLQIPVPCLPL